MSQELELKPVEEPVSLDGIVENYNTKDQKEAGWLRSVPHWKLLLEATATKSTPKVEMHGEYKDVRMRTRKPYIKYSGFGQKYIITERWTEKVLARQWPVHKTEISFETTYVFGRKQVQFADVAEILPEMLEHFAWSKVSEQWSKLRQEPTRKLKLCSISSEFRRLPSVEYKEVEDFLLSDRSYYTVSSDYPRVFKLSAEFISQWLSNSLEQGKRFNLLKPIYFLDQPSSIWSDQFTMSQGALLCDYFIDSFSPDKGYKVVVDLHKNWPQLMGYESPEFMNKVNNQRAQLGLELVPYDPDKKVVLYTEQ